MKKVLLGLVLLVGGSFAQDNIATHEMKMQQMQKKTQLKDGSGQVNQYKNQYKNSYQNASIHRSSSASQNMFKGSQGRGGGSKR